MTQALENRAQELSQLTTERDALKARVELMQSGHQEDLTMMVGHKLEAENSEEVTQLKEQLEKAEVRKQRIMEAFKKTSKDFREVVYELTGYRIDVLADHKYRVRPLYAETNEQTLLFQKTPSRCSLLGSSGISGGSRRGTRRTRRWMKKRV